VEDKQHWSVIGWVSKNLSSQRYIIDYIFKEGLCPSIGDMTDEDED
jgi:lipid-A-disaccharide synthase-like uncharacterized protein